MCRIFNVNTGNTIKIFDAGVLKVTEALPEKQFFLALHENYTFQAQGALLLNVHVKSNITNHYLHVNHLSQGSNWPTHSFVSNPNKAHSNLFYTHVLFVSVRRLGTCEFIHLKCYM